jgi:acetolactate synthase-1/2/3 large subunit
MNVTMRVADYIAQTVQKTGAECYFMLSGGMMMHLMDAFGRIPHLRYYCNHHEQACAMGADAYARQSGKLGVCMATSGPGATNLLTGLVGAYQDSVPILFITGQCKREDTARASGIAGLRQMGFLEVDIVPIVESVTKYAAFIESPERARYHLEKALHLAQEGRPGPVLLDIPLDVQGAAYPEDSAPYQPEPSSAEPASDADLLGLLDRIAQARRPVILAGHGVRCASQAAAFLQIVECLQIPVLTSLMAKDLMPFDHPLWVGHPGPRAHRAANFAVQTADLIVTMGCSLHIQTVGYEGDMFAPHAEKIQIDLERPLLQREKVGVHRKYAWDIHDYLPRLAAAASRVANCVPTAWRDVCQRWKREYNIMKDSHLLGEASDRVNLYEFVDLLSDALAGDETILTDAGQPHPILGQAFRVKGTQRYLNPGSFAEMGWALPASFGVAAADASKNVVAVIGDGSLQTNIQELQTLAHHQFNVKLFVINNDGYGSIRRTQETFFKGFYVGSTPGSGVTLPDTEKVAGAYGVPFVRLESRGVARERIADVLSRRGPVLCEVMGQIDQRILPVVASRLLPDGRMRSNSLEEMNPDPGVTFAEIRSQAGI